MYAEHKDEAEFLLVYILEAHPVDGWKVASNERAGIEVKQPKTFLERMQVAQTCSARLNIDFPTLVDTIDNQTEQAYAAWPDRLYIVGADGKIAYKGGMGPGGFRVPEMATELKRILAGQAGK